MDKLIEFESLAAKKELEGDGEFYLTFLENTLNKEDNKNIAITGGYGAGKTTIINSYFDKYKVMANKMIKVSIATFQTEQDNSDLSRSDENVLEQQILQQMVYQVNPNRILNSRFIKISDLSFWYLFSFLLF
ncbi:YobI family P-loop NTPase [Shouchella patagoniensis]|uniref:YobI family P-loop NTPase n=1 Tax=Shouchella patagoniensis TaxID=228576 RepID=UPI000994E704|nr:P-loop NTPase fold protein [Shouchella patagoniensis]